mgnify:FL=1|jgi:hypothetical protein
MAFENDNFEFPREVPTDKHIHRGYVRLLDEVFSGTADTDTSNLAAKLNFQFNPNQLTRSVSARTDTQLWINQAPSQLLQPAIGDMTFGWTMLLNREAEVADYEGRNNPSSRRDSLEEDATLSAGPANLGRDSADVTVHLWNPGRVGVVHDIDILDRIVGQRITEEQIEFSNMQHKQLVKIGVITEEEDDDDENSYQRVSGDTIVSANAHNSAFLIPNPIRAVFSESFMIDGYVSNVTVSFQKFSPRMTPTVAIVDVAMHAIYSGFARKETVFTNLITAQQLETQAVDEVEEAEPPPEGTEASGLHALAEQGGAAMPFSGIATVLPSLRSHSTTHALVSPSGVLEGVETEGSSIYVGAHTTDSVLGEEIEKRYEGDDSNNLNLSKLATTAKVGLSVRARLHTTTLGDILKLVSDGDEGGFSSYIQSDVFFGDWSVEQRTALLKVGVDVLENDSEEENGQALTEFSYQTGPTFYTRSFPILEVGSGKYGDVGYPDTTSSITPPVMSVAAATEWDLDDQGRFSLFTSDNHLLGTDTGASSGFIYNIGAGFFHTNNKTPYPTTLTINHQTDPAQDLLFSVDYQISIIYETSVTSTEGLTGGGVATIHDGSPLKVLPLCSTYGAQTPQSRGFKEGWGHGAGGLPLLGDNGSSSIVGDDTTVLGDSTRWITSVGGDAGPRHAFFGYPTGQLTDVGVTLPYTRITPIGKD